MRKIALAVAAVAVIGFGMDTSEAQAQGLHIGGRGFHVDIGNPHGRYHGQSNFSSRYRSVPSYHNYRVQSYRPSYQRGHYDYHDTSHFDYIPSRVVRHGNHYDYQPARYQFHRTGHYDYHRGNRIIHLGH
jgi:hypothetical protein